MKTDLFSIERIVMRPVFFNQQMMPGNLIIRGRLQPDSVYEYLSCIKSEYSATRVSEIL